MTSTHTRRAFRRGRVAGWAAVLCIVLGAGAVTADAPAGARRAAGDYLNYLIEMDHREPGFLLVSFGSEEPTVKSVRLGEPYGIYRLTEDGLRSFAASKRADLLEFAQSTGFGFPVVSSEQIIGAITCGVASEDIGRSTGDSTFAASIKRNDGWLWNGILKENSQVLEVVRGVRAAGDDDLTMLSIPGQGAFLLVVRRGRIKQIAATAPGSPLFAGVAKEGDATTFVLTDYKTAEPIMRANARRELGIDGKK